MAAPNGTIHFKIKLNPLAKDKHPNIEPLCNSESLRLLGQPSIGYMLFDVSAVTCLACKILLERSQYEAHNKD